MSVERVNKYAVRLANGGVSHVEGESIDFGPEWITVASGDDSDRIITAYFRLDQVFAVHVTPLEAPAVVDQPSTDKKFLLIDGDGLLERGSLIYIHDK